MIKKFYSQIDPKWKYERRYHQESADSLQELDELILDYLQGTRDQPQKKKIQQALARFRSGIQSLIKDKLDKPIKTLGYSIYNYGCWECTIAMIIAQFEEMIYPEEEGVELEPTPTNLIYALRSWQILSLIGFSFDMVVDPVSVVTKANVQMYLHEDYGVNGSSIKDAVVFNYALFLLKKIKKVGVAVCVEGHPSFGCGENAHWVYIDPESTCENLIVADPSEKAPAKFAYTKIYEVCVYSTSSQIKDILDTKQMKTFNKQFKNLKLVA